MSSSTTQRVNHLKYVLQREIKATTRRHEEAIANWARLYGSADSIYSRRGFKTRRSDWIKGRTMGEIPLIQRSLADAVVKAAMGFE